MKNTNYNYNLKCIVTIFTNCESTKSRFKNNSKHIKDYIIYIIHIYMNN